MIDQRRRDADDAATGSKWSSPAIFIHAVYPTRRFAPSKLQGLSRRAQSLEVSIVASARLRPPLL
jgi:hypothetical protein